MQLHKEIAEVSEKLPAIILNPEMEKAGSSAMSVLTTTTHRHVPGNLNLHLIFKRDVIYFLIHASNNLSFP
jgi:hypothetical protein